MGKCYCLIVVVMSFPVVISTPISMGEEKRSVGIRKKVRSLDRAAHLREVVNTYYMLGTHFNGGGGL